MVIGNCGVLGSGGKIWWWRQSVCTPYSPTTETLSSQFTNYVMSLFGQGHLVKKPDSFHLFRYLGDPQLNQTNWVSMLNRYCDDMLKDFTPFVIKSIHHFIEYFWGILKNMNHCTFWWWSHARSTALHCILQLLR